MASGKANDFYTVSDNRIFITDDFCSTIITECAPTFALFNEALEIANAINELDVAISGTVPTGLFAVDTESVSQSDWKTCADDLEACATNTDLIASLCPEVPIVGENNALEGEALILENAVTALKETFVDTFTGTKDGVKGPKSGDAQPAARLLRRRRVLSDDDDEDDDVVYTSISTSGANVSDDGDYTAGDAADDDAANAIDATADAESENQSVDEDSTSGGLFKNIITALILIGIATL